MFTGIIEVMSDVLKEETVDSLMELTIARPEDWDICIGQSIAVEGVCLTVEAFDDRQFTVKLMGETLAKTTFGTKVPTRVNLERAMAANGRFEGHVVQGHVDCAGSVTAIGETDGWHTVTFSYPTELAHLIVQKGSITVNGVSLTVVDPTPGQFSVALIPHTLTNTTLGTLAEGDMVNLEFDILGKYILNGNQCSC